MPHHQRQQHGQCRRAEEESQGGNAYLARSRAGAQIGGPRQDGNCHQRDHQHLDQLDKEGTKRCKDAGLFTHERPHQCAQHHGNHNLEANVLNESFC